MPLTWSDGRDSSPRGGWPPSRWYAWTPTRAAAKRSGASRRKACWANKRGRQPTRPRIVGLANRALDDCRRRTRNDTLGHRGRRGDPLYGARKMLLTGAERLDPRGWEQMRKALDQGDPCDEAADCWQAKEKIRSVFNTGDPDQASDLLDDAIAYCLAPEAAPELHKLARTPNRWRQEIKTSISTGAHNGRTEAANAKTKDIKRTGRGYTDLDNYRLRILFAAGRQPGQTQPVTKIRTQRPSLDA